MFNRIIEDAVRLTFGQWMYVTILVGGYFTIIGIAISGNKSKKKP